MGSFVSRKEAAADLGFSRQRLEKLIRQGRVIETEQGVDIEQARQVRETMLDARRLFAASPSEQQKLDEPAAPPAQASPAKAQRKTYNVPRGSQKVADGDGELFDFATAKTHRERANAKLAELRYLEQSGKLIPADEVKAKEFAVARKLRDRILGFPARIQNFLPPEAMQVMIEECDQLVRELQEDAASIAERSS